MDVYLLKKIWRNNDKSFGFVRDRTKEDALKAIRRLNGQVIRECKIIMKEARYAKRDGKQVRQEEGNGGFAHKKTRYVDAKRDHGTYREAVIGVKNQDEPLTIVITGEVAEENRRWLRRSIVAEDLNPVKIENVKRGLENRGVKYIKVSLIDSYKALITLKIEQEAEEIIKRGNNYLQLEMEEIRQWIPEEVCKEIRVWLECIGIPLHAWSIENFVSIGNHWGRFLKCHEDTI